MTNDPSRAPAQVDARWPDHVLGGLVLVSIWGLFVFTAQSGNAFTTYLIPIVLLAAARRYRSTLRSLARDPLYLCFVVLLVYLGASAAWTEGTTLIEFVKAQSRLLFIGSYVTAVVLLTNRFPRLVYWMVAGTVVAAAFSASYVLVTQHTDEGRLIGFGDLDRAVVAGVSWAAASVFAILLLLPLRPYASTPSRLVQAGLVLAAVATLAAMLWSGSRTAWVAYTIAIGCITLLTSRRRTWVLGFWLLLAAGAAMLLQHGAANEWLLPRGDSFRWAIWSSTLDATTRGPWLFGHGMLAEYTLETAGYKIAHPHSVYLATWYHGGLIALSIFVTLLVWTLLRAFRFRDCWSGRAAFVLMVFAMVAIASDGSELIDKVGYLWLLLWTPIAWTIALVRERSGVV